MIVGTFRILPPPHRRADVVEILSAIQGPVLAQPGCTACYVYEEEGEAVALVETWDDQASLDEHLRSEIFRRILGAVELSSRPPEIRFDHVSASEGLELVDRLRNPTQESKGEPKP